MIKKILTKAHSLLIKPKPRISVPNPRETDIYLVSYPKSGNTWMRTLLTHMADVSEIDLVQRWTSFQLRIQHDVEKMLDGSQSTETQNYKTTF
jgi:hypothetical protein